MGGLLDRQGSNQRLDDPKIGSAQQKADAANMYYSGQSTYPGQGNTRYQEEMDQKTNG